MADRGGFDPRYDPAFQRGFPGATETASGARRESPVERPEPKPHVRSAPTAFEPPRIDPVHPPRPPADDPPPAAAPPPVHRVEPAHEETGSVEGASRDPRRNPFLLAAASLGILCLLIGAFWLSRTRDFFDVGAQTNSDFWIVMVSLVGAPLLVALGIAILAGVLFFLARHWQQRIR